VGRSRTVSLRGAGGIEMAEVKSLCVHGLAKSEVTGAIEEMVNNWLSQHSEHKILSILQSHSESKQTVGSRIFVLITIVYE
jgi:hypothetical protein